MTFWQIYLQGAGLILIFMTGMWLLSVYLKNASIVDSGWGLGFVILAWFWFFRTDGFLTRKLLLLTLVTIWGLRLAGYITWRNWGKGEDYRYQNFRRRYGAKYWWFSYFQVFLLQGVLLLLIASPLLAAQFYGTNSLNIIDYIAMAVWIIGFLFEAGGDFQLARFKSDPANRGKVLARGFWKYTRHPNYFGDATQWWAYGLFALAAGVWLPLFSSALMTLLLLKVSGVALLERSLRETKPAYRDYIERTNAFVPWFPKR